MIGKIHNQQYMKYWKVRNINNGMYLIKEQIVHVFTCMALLLAQRLFLYQPTFLGGILVDGERLFNRSSWLADLLVDWVITSSL